MIFQLSPENIVFPDPALAEPDGLLAVGGDLRTERLLAAYRQGDLPWFSGDTPILRYPPHERLLLFPGALKVSRKMREVLGRGRSHHSMTPVFSADIGG